MAQQYRRTQDSASTECSNPDISYSNFPEVPQSCSLYSPTPDQAQSSATENANPCPDNKPALPPKPFQGPPTYREPPVPPAHSDSNHYPDVCINSAAPQPRTVVEPHYASQITHHRERPDHLGTRTHAWVQEHKTGGKLVGEKLSSLQRKLRSLLTQSSTKESVEVEKSSVSLDGKRGTHSSTPSWGFQSSNELSHRPKSFGSVLHNVGSSSAHDQRMSYISTSAFGGNSIALTASRPTEHSHHYRGYQSQSERHPFEAPLNTSEPEDSADPDQLRDTCSKFFSRDQRISWTNYLSPRNCYSNNIKSSYDYDKLVPKEVIGRPCQEKKPEIPSNCEAIYGAVTPFPSFGKTSDVTVKPDEKLSHAQEDSYYCRRTQNLAEPSSQEETQVDETKVPNKDCVDAAESLQPGAANDCCGDTNDLYKSSSESGRGTMHSSMHGCKSVISPHSSGVSAGSNLDTSLDSDHSANGAIWAQQKHSSDEKRYGSGEFPTEQLKHIYETPNTAMNSRQLLEKERREHHDDRTSESLSVTPPLPPLSPAPSPPLSAEHSPKLSPRAKYKLSLSASALNGNYNKSEHQKHCEAQSTKSTPGKKSGVRRTTSINQSTCRHRSGKTYQCSKAPLPSNHRLGISHGNCGTKKCNSSPPSRHHSKNHLAFPSYLDNMDPELTSTTTGLDVESLLDDADEYSSDFSATASTMEPTEVSMIRKQLEGLETMYSEILHVLGVKNSCKGGMSMGSSLDMSRHSRRRVNGSMSSLTARSSASRGNPNFADKRGFSERRRVKEYRTSSAGKRLQRLESHVVTLARSVAHLSSEMRTQHVLVQELENMRQDVTWVQERLRLMQLAQGCHPSNGGGRNHQLAMPRDWDNFHKEVLELLNPCRAKKLTKFFGDEPPLIRQFLKRLGYEKYASNFENEKIGIKELPYLTEERLQKMGIPMGPRVRILQEAQSCCQQSQYKVYIV
ncbi:uncharacterized protein LOC129231482 [Uloborus diversus]|uniref:uncharacterized protein LOC129231482 n=1 Tax=Uloborus diversus TaxID=327109 RepID=UPI00240A2D59|nr:uncharacterized protein LOC129231482 [Uloborus diversus]